MSPAPIDGALRMGRHLASTAIRHGGRCTWVADERVAIHDTWQLRASALGPELATGTAGIGWFMARLARATDSDALEVVAAEALRAAVDKIDALLAEGRLGFYDGALGVMWAALDAGMAADIRELVERALDALDRVEPALAGRERLPSPALFGGEAGVTMGLLALAQLAGKAALLDAAAATAGDLAGVACALEEHALRGGAPWSANGQGFVGLAQGASGLALALIAFGGMADDASAFQAAGHAARAERVWCTGAAPWSRPVFHPWQEPAFAASSWCGGAAGIGQVRLLAHWATGDLGALADVGAAIDTVRASLAAPDIDDLSLCHGLSGWLDLLVSAGTTLGEAVHLDAGGRVGQRLLALTDSSRGSSSARSLAVASPSLLLGAAGIGAALLRLHDPVGVPSPLIPFAAQRRA